MLKTPRGFRKAHLTEHRVWNGMISRCERPNHKSYPRYGGRGITICARWRNSFVAFFEDMGPRPSLEYSLDRINPNGNYEPGNCRWSTAKEQQRNRTDSITVSFDGKTKCLATWAEEFGIDRSTLRDRINMLGVERAMKLGGSKLPIGARSHSYATSSTGLKGVYLEKGRYRARITIDHTRGPLSLGAFDSIEAAAKAYNAKALEVFGEYALLNPV